MNVNYIGGVTLTKSFSNSIVQFSFEIIDCSTLRVAVQADIIHLADFTGASLSCGCSSKSGKITLTRRSDTVTTMN